MTAIPEIIRYESLPGTVIFGVGAVTELPEVLAHRGARRVAILNGLPGEQPVADLADALGTHHVLTQEIARQHVPRDLAATVQAEVLAAGTDWLVSVGGGSALGVAKAIAHETALPIVAIPTTYAGSEMTPIWGITDAGGKAVGRDLRVLPRVVIYDPALTVGLLPAASGASGMNAVAHCVEALWTERRNPVTDAVATEALTLLGAALPRVVAAPEDLGARGEALRGAWLSGTALALAGTAIHHKICHILGGTFDLPHAETHAAVLPAVVDHFRDSAPAVVRRVARALGNPDPVDALRSLAVRAGVSVTLADLGLRASDLDVAADLVAAGAPAVPAPVSRDEVRTILARALTGR